MKQLIIWAAVISMITVLRASACFWDRDTLRDELATKASVYDIIMGQFPLHGDSYYLKRIERLRAKGKLNEAEMNDLAVAYVRIKEFDAGRRILNTLLEKNPNSYTTLSNLGVLHKKEGDFGGAVTYIERALAIKPAGHMGLGDWYVKRLTYGRDFEGQNALVPANNFLGEPYAALDQRFAHGPNRSPGLRKRYELLMKLIRNDRHFADAYLVLGDLLWQSSDLELAMRAYLHAQQLDHPNATVLESRIDAILFHWAIVPYDEKYREKIPNLEERRQAERLRFRGELAEVNRYLAAFLDAEADLIAHGTFPDFNMTANHLNRPPFRPKYTTRSAARVSVHGK